MKEHVGYYAHHHGHGHLARAGAVLSHLQAEATALTSSPLASQLEKITNIVSLPLDTDLPDNLHARAVPLPDFLHYAPTGGAGLRDRMAQIAAWIAQSQPALLVVDVSVEVALLGRLLGVPVVVVRQHGTRTDLPHRLAYEAAAALIAPYPALLEDDSAPAWVRAKTHYAGGFSRFDGRSRNGRLEGYEASNGLARAACAGRVLVFGGSGGSGRTPRQIASAATATPDWTWTVLGGAGRRSAPGAGNVQWVGWTEDLWPYLRAADVVVAHGGTNAVMEVAAAGRPLICLPEARPFDEQHAKARALARLGAAVVREQWPASEAWPALLQEAVQTGAQRLAKLNDGSGARRAAAFLDRLARQFALPAPAGATENAGVC